MPAWPLWTALTLAVIVGSAAQPATRQAWQRKPPATWALELANLGVQGLLIPALRLLLAAGLLAWAFPAGHHSLHLSAPFSFALSFVGIDYLYYLNHRLLHAPALWPLHAVHHEATAMDLLATSRNTLWSSLAIVYLWAQALLLYLVDDPVPVLLGALLTAWLDLWRHSPLHPPAWLRPLLAGWLVLPGHHARHHDASVPQANFGANLLFWDRLHGTFDPSPAGPLGHDSGLGPWQRALWPWAAHPPDAP